MMLLKLFVVVMAIIGVVECARPCDVDPVKGYPMCDYRLPLKTRVNDLVSRIKNTEKQALFGNTAAAVPSLGIPPYQWWNEALHGIRDGHGVSMVGITPYATSFPQVCTTAASFDTELFGAIGTAISTEARAFANVGHAGLTFWAPNLNIFRDPRWGRGQETPGEDPYLTEQYVLYFVRGMQGNNSASLKVSACCKHFAAYSMENGSGKVDRHAFNAVITPQDAADTYFPAFETCVSPEGGAASSMMCAYNAVNGVPSCANKYLLTDLARNTWGFDGYITGDCGAVDDVQNKHHYTSNTDDTCAAVLNAGMDIDCGDFVNKYLDKAITDGTVNISVVDNALKNLFSVQMRVGMYDPVDKQPYTSINVTQINTPEHQRLALRAALEGIVLLKNANNVLPLKKVGPIALIGPNANATVTMLGNYYGKPPFFISPLQGISAYVPTNYVKGCDIATSDLSGVTAACNLSKTATATILLLGLDQSQEAEENEHGDRKILNLPGVQQQFAMAVAGCTTAPVVLVIMSGGPVDVSFAKNYAGIAAILWVGYPGQAGGQALAQILFGDVSPSGRLSTTVYPQTFASKAAIEDMRMRPDPATGYPGRTYRFYTDNDEVFSFGFGLSYTTFSFKWTESTLASSLFFSANHLMSLSSAVGYSRFSTQPLANLTVLVTNTGQRTSDVSVLLFIKGPPSPGSPLESLAGFQRVKGLPAGKSVTLSFPITTYHLSHANQKGKHVAQSGMWQVRVEDAVLPITVT